MSDGVFGLGQGGSELFEALKSGDRVRDALALEAARTKDRLDELDNIIQGKGVLDLMQFRLTDLPEGDGDPYVVEVKFQSVLAEARGQQASLAALLSKLAAGDAATGKPAAPVLAAVTPLDRLKERGLKKA